MEDGFEASKRAAFLAATERLARQREALGVTEEEIEADIAELHRRRSGVRAD